MVHRLDKQTNVWNPYFNLINFHEVNFSQQQMRMMHVSNNDDYQIN